VPRGAPGKLKAAAEAFYRPTQVAGQGNAFASMLAAAAEKEVVEVWPDAWRSWVVFMTMGTQWNVGPGGRTGLRYESLYPLLDRMHLTDDEWQSLFDDVQLMERAALAAMYP
jgi:hypothetical protein